MKHLLIYTSDSTCLESILLYLHDYIQNSYAIFLSNFGKTSLFLASKQYFVFNKNPDFYFDIYNDFNDVLS